MYNTITFKYINNSCPYYLHQIVEQIREIKFEKLKFLSCNTNMGQKAASFIGPSLWNT